MSEEYMSREKRANKHMAPEPEKKKKEKKEKTKKRGLWWKIPMWIIIVAVFCVVSAMAVNLGFSLHLRHYINSFDPVEYNDADRLVPEIDPETGYYTFTTDRELKIMMLTDIHLGGGFWSAEKDRKTVYEIITMLQKEKPDLVILDGDNTFAVPGPIYNGGGTLNNYMAARDVIQIFNHEGVYFSTVFGNHDTEVFDYTGRQKLGELYMKDRFEYCIFDQNYTDGGDLPTVTNQIILVKNTKGETTKALLLGLYAENIRNVLIVTGDPIPTAERDEVKSVYHFNSRKLGAFVNSLNEETFREPIQVFGALDVNAVNFPMELKRAKEKEAAGMVGFLTQPVLSEEALENLKLARKELTGWLLGGIIPVVSHRNAVFMNNEINGITVSQEIIDRYEGLERKEAEDLAVEISGEIAGKIRPYIDGYYLMTPMRRISLMERILQKLQQTEK